MKISFDYDGTLTKPAIQVKALDAIKNKDQVYIITARNESDSAQVYHTANKLGISRSNIHFTNGKDKWEEIAKLGIELHYENNPTQVMSIRKNTNCKVKYVK